MFDSLKNLVNVPLGIKAFKEQSGTGVKTYADVVNTVCYPVANVVVIKNSLGKEVTSATQLYIEGATALTEMDLVVFEGTEFAIEKVSTYYENGVPDIRVVYL